MFKKVTISVLCVLTLLHASDYERANSAAAQAMGDLDCEFEDCSKPQAVQTPQQPKVIVKERVIIKEKPVYVDRVVVKEKVIYKEQPRHSIIPVAVQKKVEPREEPKAVDNRKYNTLFLDISVPNDPTFVRDYLYITKRAGGADWNEVKKKLTNAPKRGPYSIKVSGYIELPKSYDTQSLYIKTLDGRADPHLIIAGKRYTNEELVIKNDYKNSKAVPFSYKVVWPNYDYLSNVYRFLERKALSLSFMVSKKPQKRGEEKEYQPARVFIEE